MKVQDIMTKNAQSCRDEANLSMAALIMWDSDCGAVPVINELGKVIGMITDRDIAIAVATKGRLASEITVAEVISGHTHTAQPGEDVRSALKTMRQEQVRRLPVTNDDGTLQGILSLSDIVRHIGEPAGKQASGLSYEDVVSTYRAICEHHPHRSVLSAQGG